MAFSSDRSSECEVGGNWDVVFLSTPVMRPDPATPRLGRPRRTPPARSSAPERLNGVGFDLVNFKSVSEMEMDRPTHPDEVRCQNLALFAATPLRSAVS